MAETRAQAALKESTLREVFHYGIYINRLVNISITAKPEIRSPLILTLSKLEKSTVEKRFQPSDTTETIS